MFRKSSFARLFFATAIIGVATVSAVPQSERNQRPLVVDSKTYERVLDLLFPRDVLKDHKIRYAFVLRYEPSFRPESQIVIVGRQEGVEVITYKSIDGSIEVKLDNMLRAGSKENPERMAKRLRIQGHAWGSGLRFVRFSTNAVPLLQVITLFAKISHRIWPSIL